MKALDFNKLAGDTPLDKLKSIWPTCNYIYAQEKINGVQIRMDNTIQSTRNGKVFPKNFFPEKFQAAFSHIPYGACLMGELYIPNVPLATLAGAVNVNSARLNPAYTDALQIHVWDIHHWYEAPVNWQFEPRHNKLADVCNKLNTFYQVCPVKCYTSAEAEALYQQLCKRPEAEGVIYHIPPALHFISDDVSTDLIKRKRRHETEYPCIGVTEGKGKRQGLLGAFLLQTEKGVLKVGGGTGLTDEQLQHYYHNPPLGQPITISYEELSVNGLPLRAQFVSVRNYE